MKLDYIENVNAYGDDMVRLYEFGMSEAILFRDAIQNSLILNQEPLNISELAFIKARNCQLTLHISDEDNGIITEDKQVFICELTLEGYQQMLKTLEPFCNKETKGYQWLYDVDSSTDFLFSPGGTW